MGSRRHIRVAVVGRAVVHATGTVIGCDIENVSLGGTLLKAAPGTAIHLEVGTPVVIELHVTGTAASWLAGRAHVQRLADAERFAVQFDDIPAELEDLIEDEVLAAEEARATPRVILVDRPGERRQRVAATLRRAGFRPVVATTPLDAIQRVDASRTHAIAVIVAEDLTQTHGDELAHFLRDQHPSLRVVLLRERAAGAAAAIDQSDGVVVAAPEDCDRSDLVRELVAPD